MAKEKQIRKLPKLPKRLNLFFFVLSVGVLYGTFYLFIEPHLKSSSKYSAKQSDELIAFTADISTRLYKKSTALKNAYIIESAELRWLSDPFYSVFEYGDFYMSDAAAPEDIVEEIDFAYTGYMDVSGVSFAIINNVEYKIGDTLEDGGGMYSLQDINPSKVSIRNKAKDKDIVVLLPEIKMNKKAPKFLLSEKVKPVEKPTKPGGGKKAKLTAQSSTGKKKKKDKPKVRGDDLTEIMDQLQERNEEVARQLQGALSQINDMMPGGGSSMSDLDLSGVGGSDSMGGISNIDDIMSDLNGGSGKKKKGSHRESSRGSSRR